MSSRCANPVVHLELHTGDRAAASEVFSALCGWRSEVVEVGSSSYLALELGRGLGGGIVECATQRPVWLPYVRVDDVHAATARAPTLGGAVLLEPREGPAGWRSVVATPMGGELAFWQHKR